MAEECRGSDFKTSFYWRQWTLLRAANFVNLTIAVRCSVCLLLLRYCVAGTLFDQVIYPGSLVDGKLCLADKVVPASDLVRTVSKCLESVWLDRVVARFGTFTVQKWDDVLSGGEKQRLGIARLLFHRPSVGITDECTSALDGKTELACLHALNNMGAAYLHIGNRPSLRLFSKEVIQLSVGKNGVHQRLETDSNLNAVEGKTDAANHRSSQLSSGPSSSDTDNSVVNVPTLVSDASKNATDAALKAPRRNAFVRLRALLRIAFPRFFAKGTFVAIGGIIGHLGTAFALWCSNHYLPSLFSAFLFLSSFPVRHALCVLQF